jgi:hypothetical protein
LFWAAVNPHYLLCSNAARNAQASRCAAAGVLLLNAPLPTVVFAVSAIVWMPRHGPSLLLSGPRAVFADGLAIEFDPVGVMDNAVEDGIGVGGLADEFMPCVYGRLAGDDG